MQTLKDSLLYELREEVSKTLNKLPVDTQLVSYTAEIPTGFLFNILPYSYQNTNFERSGRRDRGSSVCASWLYPKGQ